MIKKGIALAVIIMFSTTAFIPITGSLPVKDIALNKNYEITVYCEKEEENQGLIRNKSIEVYPEIDDIADIDSETRSPPQTPSSYDISFTYPLNNDIFRAGDTIPIIGTISGRYGLRKFNRYTVEYGPGINPTEWYTTGITLINEGKTQITNDTVATWDTSHIIEPEFFTLQITTTFSFAKPIAIFQSLQMLFHQKLPQHVPMNTITIQIATTPFLGKQVNAFIKNIYLDPSLKEGWPQRIDWYYDEEKQGFYIPGESEPVVSDINNDGDMEIVVYMGANPPKIYAFNQDGSLVDGWPAAVEGEDLPGGSIGAPTIADIDNDGYQEIFVNGRYGIYIFNHNGSFLRKIIQGGSNRPRYGQECVVYDLDNDGNMEIIKKYAVYDNYRDMRGLNITVFDIYGNVLSGWPQMYYDFEGPDGKLYGYSEEGMPAIGNFDDDSDLEIVVGGNRNQFDDPSNPGGTWHVRGRITVYNLNGSVLDGFPLNLTGFFCGQAPAIGDVNNDGDDEIVAAAKKLYVIDRYGNNCTGWPIEGEKFQSASPALADFDNDGFLEIVISKLEDPLHTFIFDYQGNVLSGWPQTTSYIDIRGPVVGDVNGDGSPDVVTTAGNGVGDWCSEDGGVYAWNGDGSLINGFPKVTDSDARSGATIADIDNDGKVEIIASSSWDFDFETMEAKHRSTIYIWELDSDFNEETLEWPMFHHDTMHTGYYALDFPILIKNYLK